MNFLNSQGNYMDYCSCGGCKMRTGCTVQSVEEPEIGLMIEQAELELKVQIAMVRRANREGLWDMPLKEIDLIAMAEEIVEALNEQG